MQDSLVHCDHYRKHVSQNTAEMYLTLGKQNALDLYIYFKVYGKICGHDPCCV